MGETDKKDVTEILDFIRDFLDGDDASPAITAAKIALFDDLMPEDPTLYGSNDVVVIEGPAESGLKIEIIGETTRVTVAPEMVEPYYDFDFEEEFGSYSLSHPHQDHPVTLIDMAATI